MASLFEVKIWRGQTPLPISYSSSFGHRMAIFALFNLFDEFGDSWLLFLFFVKWEWR
jgi:hypothetical protein